MIIKDDKTIETGTNSSVKDTEVVIDSSKSAKLFAILLESYKNPRASLVREYTSNAWDAQQQNGKTDVPVIVQIDEDEGGKYIQFIDEGVGMTYAFFGRVYSKLLSSTKENSNDEIGGFGIGSKTALAYTDYYHVESVKNGRYNHFVIYKESNSSIKITRIASRKDNTLTSGTKVKVYFKEESQDSEEKLFEDICVKELCYFDNVILRFKSNTSKASTYNFYKIIEADTFKYKSGYNYDNNIHLVLGKVAYPIDYRELGLDSSQYITSVALKFEIGELQVHMNRETVLYSDNAKKVIKQRLQECVEDLIVRYNNQNKPIIDYVTYLRELAVEKSNNTKVIKIDSINQIVLYGQAITKNLPDVKFAPSLLLGFKQSPSAEEIMPFIRVTHHLHNSKAVRKNIHIKEISNSSTLVFYRDKEPFNSNEFMKYMEHAYFVKVDKYYALQDYLSSRFRALKKLLVGSVVKRRYKKDIYGEFVFDEYNAEESSLGTGKRFLAYRRELMSQIKSKFVRIIDYDAFEVPLEWKEEQKAIKRENRVKIERAQGIIPSRQVNLVNGYMYSLDLDLSKLHDFKGIIIYGFQDNKEKLLDVYKILVVNKYMMEKANIDRFEDKSLLIVQLAKNNVKSMQTFKNAVHVNTFLRSQNRVIVRIYTAYKIRIEFNQILSRHETLAKLNSKMGESLKTLYNYSENALIYSRQSSTLRELVKELDSMSSIIPMFDKKVLKEFEDCKRYFKDLTLLKNISIDQLPLSNLVEILKANGKMLDYHHYNKAKVIPVCEIQKTYRLVERPMTDLRNYTPRPQVIN